MLFTTLYIILASLNLTLFIYFIVYYLKAAKYIRDNIGKLPALIFVLALISFISRSPDTNTRADKKFDLRVQKEINQNNTRLFSRDLTGHAIFKVGLDVTYRKIDSLHVEALYATTSATGLIAGLAWEPLNVSIDIKGSKLTYDVDGSFKWSLMGITFYTESKEFSGEGEIILK